MFSAFPSAGGATVCSPRCDAMQPQSFILNCRFGSHVMRRVRLLKTIELCAKVPLSGQLDWSTPRAALGFRYLKSASLQFSRATSSLKARHNPVKVENYQATLHTNHCIPLSAFCRGLLYSCSRQRATSARVNFPSVETNCLFCGGLFGRLCT